MASKAQQAGEIPTAGAVSAQPRIADTSTAPLVPRVDDRTMELHPTPCFSILCGLLFCPCTLMSSWFTLKEGEQKIILNTGRLIAEIKEPGCYFFNCCQREVRTVSTKKRCIEIKHCKVSDKDGNPIVVSAVVVMQVHAPRLVLLGVQNWVAFAQQQGMTILRQIVSQYSYESRDGSPSLRSDSAHINERLAEALNHVVDPIGVKVISFRLDEIAFSSEIAGLMLKRQAAKAVVDARRVIVDGAVSLTQNAIAALDAQGVRLTREQTSLLVSNLLTVLCSTESEG